VRESDGPPEVQEKVTAVLRRLDGAPATILTPLLELLGVPVADPAWIALEPAGRRQAILDGVCQLLLRESRDQALLIVVEDLQGLDSESQALLDRLVARLPGERVLLVVTYRPEHTHGWSGLGHYAQLPIVPLPRDEAEDLLQDLLGMEPGLSALVALLVERADGNPLFLEASVSDLVEAQVLVGQWGSYRLERPVTALHVPSTVQAILAARIDRLTEEDRRLLQCAAAIGKDVPVALLAAITDLGEPEVLRRLDRLRARGFLYESAFPPAQAFTFDHVLTLEVALGSLLSETRRTLDARIVETVERLYPDRLGDHVERLAHHAVRGEVWDKAVRYCREAGARAAARSAHRAAVGHFERALGALANLEQTPARLAEAVDLRLDLRSVLIPLGQFRRTVKSLQEAQALARMLGDERRLGILDSHLANYLHLTGHLAGAVEQAQDALAIATRLDDLPLRIVTTAYLGFVYHTQGRYRESAELSRRNVATLRGDLETQRLGMAALPAVYSRTCLAWALAELGEFAEAEAAGREALAVADRAAHSYSLVYACLAGGVVGLRRGDFEAAAGWLERGLGICHAQDIPVLLAMVTVPLVSAYAYGGRVTDALRVLDESDQRARQIGDPIGHWLRTGALAEVHVLAGRAAEARPLALEYLAQRRLIRAEGYEAWALLLLADVTAGLGTEAREEASALYRDAAGLAGRLEMRPLVARCRLGLGCLGRRAGQPAEAEAALLAAADLFRSMGMAWWQGRAERELAAVG
jgi:predicted ATPase